jgi:hypothetical protein
VTFIGAFLVITAEKVRFIWFCNYIFRVVVRLRKNHAAVIFLLLIVSLHAVYTPEAAAPPFGTGYTCGLISDYRSTNVRISHASLNATVIIESDGENLTYRFEIVSSYSLTNTADHDVSFVTSYVRGPWDPFTAYEDTPDNLTIAGNSSMYSASVTYNISTRAELPEVLQSIYLTSFFSASYFPSIDVVNITMAASAELTLTFRTILEERCIGNFFDFRFGLDIQKLESDSTQLDATLKITNPSLLFRTDLLNSHSRSVTQTGDSLVVTWFLSDWDWGGESTYPGMQISGDVFGDYLGVQLWQSEYRPPGPEWVDMAPLIIAALISLVTLLAVWARWAPR